MPTLLRRLGLRFRTVSRNRCSQFYFTSGVNAGLGVGGVYVLQYNDSVATQVDQQCVASADAGAGVCGALEECAQMVAEGAVEVPAACQGDE
jgi:hypothetical protein